MTQADIQYNKIISNIIKNGKWDIDVRPKWKDGTPARTISTLNERMIFDNRLEIPLITSKRVAVKSALIEMFWIWQKKSNYVPELRKMGSRVWDEFELSDGTIGKSYAWQLANKKREVKLTEKLIKMIENGELSLKHYDTYNDVVYLDQVDYLIYILKTNPSSRRIKTTLWCVEDLDEMSLEPCVYETHWQYWDNKLHLTVNIRSNDMGLGNAFNIYQYSVLHRMIAQVVDIAVGTICFNIDNAHIYDRHIQPLSQQIKREQYEAPTLWINPKVKNFYDFTIDDFKLIDYKHGDKIEMEVAL